MLMYETHTRHRGAPESFISWAWSGVVASTQTGYIVARLCVGSNPATGLVSQKLSNPDPNRNSNPNLT